MKELHKKELTDNQQLATLSTVPLKSQRTRNAAIAKISLPPHFCPHCGAKVLRSHAICTVCHTPLGTDAQSETNPYTQTLKFTPSTRADAPTDADATIRARPRLSTQMYTQAARQVTEDSRLSAPLQAVSVGTEPDQVANLVTTKLHTPRPKTRIVQLCCGGALLLLLFTIISGIASATDYTQAQRHANENKATLDLHIQQAVALGVPPALLQPILDQEHNTNTLYRWLQLFPNIPGVTIYQQQAHTYQQLQKQLPAIVTTATTQAQAQAQLDLQNFQTVLSTQNLHPIGNLHAFSQRFGQDQLLISSAQTPKEYTIISQNARQSVTALSLLATTSQQLTDLNTTLARIQQGNIDVTAMQTQYQHDLALFNAADQPQDFQNLKIQIATQYQQLLALSIHAFPYVSATRLNELTAQIQTLKNYGIDTTRYQQQLDKDQITRDQATTTTTQLAFFKQVDSDISSMQGDLTSGQAHALVVQFQQQTTDWARAHSYHDTVDGHDYALNNGYADNGIAATLTMDLKHATSLTDYQAVIAETQNALFSQQAFIDNSADTKPFDQAHATDTRLLEHYQLQQKQVLLVSLSEQAMRVYQHGSLQRAYQVTTGRQELPSLPGVWSVLDRKSPIMFTSGEPKNSPYWFPVTPINYAILYHYSGYYLHDAPWRADFGPGTQFPHQDASGTTAYNFDGSHGCVNLQEDAAKWIYEHTDWNTIIVIY